MIETSLRHRVMLVIVLGAAFWCRPAQAAAGSPREAAKQILAQTGVKGGLVVHVGCGDGKLTAALRANQSYVVHGLDQDPLNVAEARRHAQSLGLYGKVTILV